LNTKKVLRSLETSFEASEYDFEVECHKKSVEDGDPAWHPMAMGVASEPPYGQGWPRCMATPDGLVVLVATLILFFVLVFCFHLKFLHFS
jgi:hypothetical protein